MGLGDAMYWSTSTYIVGQKIRDIYYGVKEKRNRIGFTYMHILSNLIYIRSFSHGELAIDRSARPFHMRSQGQGFLAVAVGDDVAKTGIT